MLKICLTYDYELFLGENLVSYEELLFGPTSALSEMMISKGVNGTFFADVCSAIAHRRFALEDFSDRFDRQLRELTAAGHDVQLHLHTNWFYAQRENNQLRISQKGYKIHEFGFDDAKPNCAQSIIAEGIDYLSSVCRKEKPDYRCIAYRAGGLSIQPEKALFKALQEKGIAIDSSVVPHTKVSGVVNAYDFTAVPQKLNWYIDPTKGVAHEAAQGIFEVPVATARVRLIETLRKRYDRLRLPPAPKRGRYCGNNRTKQPNRFCELWHKLFAFRPVSLDTRHCEIVFGDLLHIYKKHGLHKKDGYVSLICHPKLADDVRVENIARLIDMVNEHKDKFTFVTMTDIYKEINVK